jgi:hypothetical protein
MLACWNYLPIFLSWMKYLDIDGTFGSLQDFRGPSGQCWDGQCWENIGIELCCNLFVSLWSMSRGTLCCPFGGLHGSTFDMCDANLFVWMHLAHVCANHLSQVVSIYYGLEFWDRRRCRRIRERDSHTSYPGSHIRGGGSLCPARNLVYDHSCVIWSRHRRKEFSTFNIVCPQRMPLPCFICHLVVAFKSYSRFIFLVLQVNITCGSSLLSRCVGPPP